MIRFAVLGCGRIGRMHADNVAAHPKADAYREAGLFASQHSACKLRQDFTLERLAAHFGLDGDDA